MEVLEKIIATAEKLLKFLFSEKVVRTIVKIFLLLEKNSNAVLTE